MHTTSPQTFHLLNMARAGAALLVALGHTRGLYFEGIQTVEDPNILTLAFYLATSLQHEAVVVFFVISGFLVGGPAWRLISEGRFDPVRYLIRRFSRIYIVLIPAIGVGALLAWVGVKLFDGTRFYAQGPLFPSGFDTAWHWQQIPCHLFSVQGVFCNAFSFSPTLWSLGHEWLYYMLAPILLLAAYRPRLPMVRLLLVGLVVAVCWYTFPRVSFWLSWPLYWTLGVLAAWVHQYRPQSSIPGLAALAVCLVAFPVSRLDLVSLHTTDLWIAISLAVVLTAPGLLTFEWLPAFWKWGADFSYSLYAIHLPIGVFVAAVLEISGNAPKLIQPGLTAFAAFAITLLVILISSKLFAMVTEEKTDQLRAWLDQRVAR